MPPCVCGLKVDRNTESLACILCNGLFHLDCCNVKAADSDLIKKSYKCANCIRRGSSKPDNATIDAANGEVVVGAKLSGSSSTAAVVVACPNTDTSDALEDVAVECASVSDNALLSVLLSEVRALKSSNAELKALVSSMSEQNSKLLAKLEAFEASLGGANLSMNGAVSSPKRKKKKKNLLGENSEVSSWPSINDLVVQHNASPLPKNCATDSDASSAAPTAPFYAALLRSSSGPAATALSNVQPEWTRVGKVRKTNKNLIGTGANHDIGVIGNFKWLHLSSFNNSVTEAEIIDYLSKTSKISSKNFACYKLVKKTDDISKLKFINFKLGIVSDYYNAILSPALWPANVRVRPFIFSDKKTVPTAATFLEQQMEQPPAPTELSTQAAD